MSRVFILIIVSYVFLSFQAVNAKELPLHPFLQEIENYVKTTYEHEASDIICNFKENDSLTCQYDAQIFQVHSKIEDDNYSKEAHKELGPQSKGFVLHAKIISDKDAGPSLYAQSTHNPYWTTFESTYPITRHDFHIHITLSYGKFADLYLIGDIIGKLEHLKNGTVIKPRDIKHLSAQGENIDLTGTIPILYKSDPHNPGDILTFINSDNGSQITVAHIKSLSAHREIIKAKDLSVGNDVVVKRLGSEQYNLYKDLQKLNEEINSDDQYRIYLEKIIFGKLYKNKNDQSNEKIYIIMPFIKGQTFYDYFSYTVPENGIVDIRNNALIKFNKIIEAAELSKVFVKFGYANDDIGASNLLLDSELNLYMIDLDFVIPIESLRNPQMLLFKLMHLLYTPNEFSENAEIIQQFPYSKFIIVDNPEENVVINKMIGNLYKKFENNDYFTGSLIQEENENWKNEILGAINLLIEDLKEIVKEIQTSSKL